MLTLRVIELRGDRALIDFGRFRATADIKVPVTLGEELTVKVLDAGKQLRLGVLGSEQKNTTGAELPPSRLEVLSDENLKKIQHDLKQLLDQAGNTRCVHPLNQSITSILEKLNAHFEPFDLKKIVAELPSRLQSYLENSGILFEKRLATKIAQILAQSDAGTAKNPADHPEVKALLNRDLKPNLILLQHLVEDKAALQRIFDPGALATLKRTIDTLMTGITHQQGRAVNQQDSPDPFQIFTFTLPLKEERQAAKLKIFYEKKQKSGSQKRFQISLFLSMDRLGDIRTDFVLLENDLSITFFVAEPAIKTRIQESYAELQELLSSFFKRIQLNVRVSEEKVRDFDRPIIPKASDRNVDLRI